MSRIRVDIDTLEKEYKDMNKNIKNVDDLLSDLRFISNEVSSVWDSDGGKKYISRLDKHYKSTKKVKTLLEEYRDYIKGAIDRFKRADNAAERAINNSF